MDLHRLFLFHKVAKNLSFTKASQELHISQPSISMQIKKFEQEMGLRLFDRYGKNVFLTDDGKFMYGYSKKIFNLVEELEGEVYARKGKMLGNLSIGASNTPGIYVLPGLVGVFKARYPHVTINLYIGNTYEVENRIAMNKVDFAIIGGDIKATKNLVVDRIYEDSMVFIASPDNPITDYDNVKGGLLAHQNFISHESNSNLYNAMEKIIKRDIGIPFNTSMTLGSIDAIKHAVIANLGISLVPYISVKQDLHLGTLKEISIDKTWKYGYNLVYFKNKEFAPPVKVMLQTLRDRIEDYIEA